MQHIITMGGGVSSHRDAAGDAVFREDLIIV